MFNKLKFEEDDGLGIITFIDKPLNLIDSTFVEELESILNGKELEVIRALLFKVDRGNFSAGANVALLLEQNEKSSREMLKRFLDIVYRIEHLPFPTMAAVKGMCVGGGFELALACDYIWASENAQFAAAEVLIGIVPLGGGVQRLAVRTGITRAKEIALGGRFKKPEKLERCNVINRVLPEQELIDKAIKFMKLQSKGPTIAFNTIKMLLREFYNKGLEEINEFVKNENLIPDRIIFATNKSFRNLPLDVPIKLVNKELLPELLIEIVEKNLAFNKEDLLIVNDSELKVAGFNFVSTEDLLNYVYKYTKGGQISIYRQIDFFTEVSDDDPEVETIWKGIMLK